MALDEYRRNAIECLELADGISDTPTRTLGPLAKAVDSDGRLTLPGLVGLLTQPRRTFRAVADVRHALHTLQQSVARPERISA